MRVWFLQLMMHRARSCISAYVATLSCDSRVNLMARTFLARSLRFLASEDGPTAVEYAVMLALILVDCFTIVTTLGAGASNTFSGGQ